MAKSKSPAAIFLFDAIVPYVLAQKRCRGFEACMDDGDKAASATCIATCDPSVLSFYWELYWETDLAEALGKIKK